jgi:hypothetical protein
LGIDHFEDYESVVAILIADVDDFALEIGREVLEDGCGGFPAV